ncbi:ribose 1,5-bisphosphokinase [Rhizobiales bacterium GAS188]|nr:ribose 1,5-bisphosphokinase [Rhizobiales bacterium GAS188]
MNGVLVLVAGPSGAGKDTLIRLARERLHQDPRFVFVRRVITRPGDAGGEDHESATPEEFARQTAAGAFVLSWDAHGLRYGVPSSVETDLAEGRIAVVNVSRGVIAEATQLYPNSRVVIITAPVEMLAARLAARGREPASEHQARLARPDAVLTAQSRPIHVSNDGRPEAGAEALIAILRQCLPQEPKFPPETQSRTQSTLSAASGGPSPKVETTT